MTELEKLLAIEEIKALMARRLRCMDTKNWVEYDTCHADDATVSSFANIPDQHRPPGATARDKAEIMASVRKVVDRLTTVHHAHTPEIEITSPDTAMLGRHFADAEAECAALLRRKLALPAYDQCIKASHLFNLLDARGVISVTERASYIGRVRALAKACCEAWVAGDPA